MPDRCPGRMRLSPTQDSVVAICSCGFSIAQKRDAAIFPQALIFEMRSHLGRVPNAARGLVTLKKTKARAGDVGRVSPPWP